MMNCEERGVNKVRKERVGNGIYVDTENFPPSLFGRKEVEVEKRRRKKRRREKRRRRRRRMGRKER